MGACSSEILASDADCVTKILPADADAIREAAAILRRGGLVAFPTETVYGLGADAEECSGRAGHVRGQRAGRPIIR